MNRDSIVRIRRIQVPGQEWVFIERKTGRTDVGILPPIKGESNDFAFWDGKARGGSWVSKRFTNERAEIRRRIKGMQRRNIQTPGTFHRFIDKQTKEEDTGFLPAAHGESNNFAIWLKNSSYANGGSWVSRKLSNSLHNRRRDGLGPNGLLGRMRMVYCTSKATSKNKGYKEPKTTPEQMVLEWQKQNGRCAACGGPISIMDLKDKLKRPCYDHNHETGEPRGFIHGWCNSAEGSILRMTNEEFTNFIKWISNAHNREFNA